MPLTEERLAALEENKIHTKETIDAIFTYMKEGRAWRDDVISTLATVVNNQKSMTDYQKVCNDERAELEKKHTALDGRVTETEGYQKRQIKVTAFVSLLVSSFIGGGIMWFKKG